MRFTLLDAVLERCGDAGTPSRGAALTVIIGTYPVRIYVDMPWAPSSQVFSLSLTRGSCGRGISQSIHTTSCRHSSLRSATGTSLDVVPVCVQPLTRGSTTIKAVTVEAGCTLVKCINVLKASWTGADFGEMLCPLSTSTEGDH